MSHGQGIPVNRIACKGVNGIYKDKDIEVHIGPNGSSSKLFVDGKQPKEIISGIWIKILPGKQTSLTIETLKSLS